MVRDIAEYLDERQNGQPLRTTLVLNFNGTILVADQDRTSRVAPLSVEPVMDGRYFCVRIRQADRDIIIKFAPSKSKHGRVKATMWATPQTRIWLEKAADRVCGV